VATAGDFVCAPFEGFIPQQEAVWKAKRGYGLLPDITAAMMGWDSRPWKETTFFWSDNTPEKFRELCLRAKAFMDAGTGHGPDRNTLVFCCWNEFGEGHYIEPTRGYCFDYLDVVRDVFTDAPRHHLDITPADVGRAPCDTWYRAAREAASKSPPEAAAWSGAGLCVWEAMMGLTDTRIEHGILKGRSSTSDPAFALAHTRLRAGQFTKLMVEIRVSRPGPAQVFWTTPSEPSCSEAASVKAPVVADGQFHTCGFEVGNNAHWRGCITSLRFDPTAGKDILVEIRAIRLE
jgi:hypothetical protein